MKNPGQFKSYNNYLSTFKKFAPRMDSHERHGMLEGMGHFLKAFSTPVIWKFTPEQLQDPDKVTAYLQGECCGTFLDELWRHTLCLTPQVSDSVWITILWLEKQILQQHSTLERTESNNGTNFKNNLVDTWAREHNTE